jgi:hypothetical protein
VVFLLASVPVAFLSTIAAVGVWFLSVPGQLVLDRRRPPDAAEWF